MVKNTSDLRASPPVIPRSVNKIANNEATDAATIPRGATQATNSFCRQLRSLFQVQIHTLRGRTPTINTATVATDPQPKATTALIERLAVSKINSTEMAKTTSCP